MKIAIVEDEALYVDQLKEFIQRYQKENGTQIELFLYENGLSFISDYKGDMDIVLMDIQMPLMDGMTAAEKLRAVDGEVIIMFITNMTQYAIRGYEVDALDYILKPVNYFAFSKKLKRAIGRVSKETQRFITIKVKEGIKKVMIHELMYIESQRHYLHLYTKEEVLITRGTIKAMEEELSGDHFHRINNGVLVNMRFVSGIEEGCCVMGDQQLPISRQRKKPFMAELTKYMSEVMR